MTSDLMVGSRKEINTRDNPFVIYSVMANALNNGAELEIAHQNRKKMFEIRSS